MFQVLYCKFAALQQANKTARPEARLSQPRRCGRRPRPRPGGQRALPRRRFRPLPASCAAGATSQGAARPSSPPAPPAGAGRGQRSQASPLCTSSSTRPSPQEAPAAQCCGHVLHARLRRCCGPLLHHGRPRRWRSPRPRLRLHCRRRNSTAGKLPKAYQIMRNAATWKMNRYLCSAKIGERWESLDPILMQICKIAKPGNVHEKFIGAISSVNSSCNIHHDR